ncbi:biopolymer transporter ExbD [Pseudoxanthomonas kalamensis DSM 18571]|uniref:ExbD/TolR family protein n=1 Tax=Pseudoxanthomonas kalamensis TaxID=289483 RepID=UPI001391085D|nr:biopolymer transporter ExbD [Pseudoxanthomonas kalamensis]KAF1712321.1 biopolymer transporter ExbD [Pseudoxanthomonas kalamensis DSM 18571]
MAFASAAGTHCTAELNVTPLVDVLLVLLVIFMVSAPVLTRPVDIQLPQPSPRSVDPERPRSAQLTISADGSYRLDDRPLADSELWAKLAEAVAADARMTLSVRANSDASYQRMVEAVATAHEIGIANVAMQP